MRKISFLFLLFIVASACTDDMKNQPLKYNTLTVRSGEITGAPAAGEIDAVKLVTYDNKQCELAISLWNGGFELWFPEEVSSAYLAGIEEVLQLPAILPAGFELSDTGARVCTGWVEGYRDDHYEKDFLLVKTAEDGNYTVSYIYTDRRVKVGGTYSEAGTEFRYSLTLYKGWNSVSVYRTGDGSREEYHSVLPSGLSWVYGEA